MHQQVSKLEDKSRSRFYEMSDSVDMLESVRGNTSTYEDEIREVNVEDRQQTMPRKKKMLVSNVWDSFQQIEIDGSLKANHLNLQKDAQRIMLDFQSVDAQSLAEGERKMGVLWTWRFDQETTRKALVRMIIIYELPFRFLEREGFKGLMQVACPTFCILSRIIVARDCYQFYLDEVVKMKKFLKASTQRVSLTADT
uniref:Uncharacterized protein n=1 Tax=Kalanchoe fedtschenkoi TaxID=63787 RepID=A0A7N0V4F3_KALFE